MTELTEDRLSELGDQLVKGRQTPSHVVMTRGRTLRRRRRIGGGGATLVVAAGVAGTLVHSTGVLQFGGDHRGRSGGAASGVVDPPARDRLADCDLGSVSLPQATSDPTPEESPGVLFLVDPAPAAATSAHLSRGIGVGGSCTPPTLSGADVSASGGLERSFSLTYGSIIESSDFFPNDGLPHATVRGGEALVNDDRVEWIENGLSWTWQSYGLPRAQMLAAIESFRADPADPALIVPPDSFMDVISAGTPSTGSGTNWRVDYGTGATGWSLSVEDEWNADGPPFPYLTPEATRLLSIDGRQVIVNPIDGALDGELNVGVAMWVDGRGHRYQLNGNLTDQQLREIIPNITKVAPTDQRVQDLLKG